MTIRSHRPQTAPLRWRDVDVLEYKREGAAPYRGVTRQVLFDDAALNCQLRYFEVEPGGHTTLERHEHAHAVVIQHGVGRCLVGDTVYDVAPFDLVHIPAMTWHQFRAAEGERLGFLCMVNSERDRPQLPDEEALRELKSNADVAAFIKD
jgi:quercetin dioxygenase-like cupin family protein